MQPWMDKELKYNKHGRPVTDNPKDKLYVVSTDVDGVICNWVAGFLGVFNELNGTQLTEDQWVNDEPWKAENPIMTKEQFETAFDAMLKIPEFYLNLEPYHNVDFVAINNDLDDALYNLYAVTVRVNLLAKEGIQDTTQLLSRWIRNQGVPLITGCNAGGDDRPALLEQLGVDFHLDDFHKQVKDINKYGKTKAFLMDRPWNRQYTELDDVRCTSFDDFLMRTIFADREVEARSE